MIFRSSCPRLHLFSGHDTTLVPLLKGIGAWNDVWPPYSSDLAFELYEDSSGDHLVKIVYNGQVVFNFRSTELLLVILAPHHTVVQFCPVCLLQLKYEYIDRTISQSAHV